MATGSYSKIIEKYPKIKVHINNDGEIVTIEKETNGIWFSDSTLISFFEKLPKRLHIHKKATITFIQ